MVQHGSELVVPWTELYGSLYGTLLLLLHTVAPMIYAQLHIQQSEVLFSTLFSADPDVPMSAFWWLCDTTRQPLRT
ncbi:uncharacterized protein B0T15DRAFT_531395 [Chaetomium strumarium]|uniref:Uncharacterized protein n=1 Tax=Chaetomium strumarium TaxID=1170767 RepID=A0AAJ0M171_9PEZI|nr:hypothetical protein B0T15DRAFT_531395 [Chaetomium strumarium]